MISRNVLMLRSGKNEYVIHVIDPELDGLFEKHGGMVNVKIGKPVTPGTENQNRLMHSLLTVYYVTGLHSAPEGCTLDVFKIYMKIQYGPCYEMDYQGHPVRVPKSWAEYAKQERADLIEGLISEIHQSGAYAASEKLREIIAGMTTE